MTNDETPKDEGMTSSNDEWQGATRDSMLRCEFLRLHLRIGRRRPGSRRPASNDNAAAVRRTIRH